MGVHEDASSCSSVAPSAATLLSTPVPTGVKTLILTDTGRMSGSGIGAMQAKLQSFAALPQVGGAIVDVVSQSPRVSALFAQADANSSCVYAENLVADAIRDIVAAYRAANPGLADIVIVGNDNAIPFFRYPDASGLGTESNYVPPVADNSSSQASLRLNYVLSQDAYGADTTVQLNGIAVPVPDLPVGRLVETPTEISGILDAYMTGTTNGAVTPHLVARDRLRLPQRGRPAGPGRVQREVRRRRRLADRPAGGGPRPVVERGRSAGPSCSARRTGSSSSPATSAPTTPSPPTTRPRWTRASSPPRR